ncbi:MAG: hypothetical protein AAF721_13700 [Myxococcota bacterium]
MAIGIASLALACEGATDSLAGGGGAEGSEEPAAGESGESGGAGGSGEAGGADADGLPEPGAGTFVVLDELGDLPRGDAANEAFCATAHSPHPNDRVRTTFCGPDGFPDVTSLAQLLDVLEIDRDFSPASEFNLALSAHSSSISSRTVSSINPRVFIYSRLNEGDEIADDDFFPRRGIVVSYTRGEPYIEIMAKHDRGDAAEPRNWVNFYLIKFDKPCEKAGTCTPADFYTDAYEDGWEQISVYEDHVLRDTTLDCLGCHQPPSAGGAKIMLFAEDRNDFVHWFNPTEGGFNREPTRYYDTFGDFHGDADYGVIPADQLSNADPDGLWSLMYRSGSLEQQPVEFKPSAIRRELDDAGESPTWNALYEAFVAGETPPPPHFAARVDAQDRISELAAAYDEFRHGEREAADVPDLRAALEPANLRDMGLGVRDGLGAEEILVNGCAQCHRANNAADSVRSRFLVDDVTALSEHEKQTAIERLLLPEDDPRRMPPVRFRSLSANEVDSVVEFLER